MSQNKMKRFYRAVAVTPDPEPGAFRVTLDGRPIRTPAKAVLRVPRAAFADAIAAEWAGQGQEVDPRSMPLTALACTAIDLVGPKRGQILDEAVAYGGHDLLCYRAEAPADLAARQQAVWQPLLDWAAVTFDASLMATSGLVSVAQPAAAVAALRRAVEALDDYELAALSAAVAAAGSLVLALALRAGRIDTAQALAAAQLDDLYQAERWGDDPETRRRRAGIEADLTDAAQVFALMRA